jgi:site-specific recombinase XerD
MSDLRKRFVEDLTLRNYARRTIETYTRHVACFARYFGRSPEALGPEEIRSYQLYLIQEKRASWSTFNQAVCALRFLYRITLPREWAVTMIAYAKKPQKLPSVLGAEEVEKLLACAQPVKPRLVLATLCSGTATGQTLHLKPYDIDSSPMLLHVHRARVPSSGWCFCAAVADGIAGVLAGVSAVWLFPGADGGGRGPATVEAVARRP